MIYVNAFLFCGFICMLGQIIYDHTKLTPGHITSLFVVLGALLDFFHIYDLCINWAGMGASLPILSFGHSLMHAAMDSVKDMGFLGLAVGMFDMVAPGITAAIFFAFLTAILFKAKS
ncbi:MAG: SpoVA/SpoVAEb family sporulation membrane protein [Erysipelotrichia bacterium]|nr:SpoVA/SpoVAEb family sporulation membrane protein [Erysipelotrichia bacterium]NCC55191.1 SpoVA/SpoVAEb family sporulation membrane protein [Erysipelotrichia bacterium]